MDLNGNETNESMNVISGGNYNKWIGEEIRDEEIRMIDEILRSYSTLTILDMRCEFEKKRKKER